MLDPTEFGKAVAWIVLDAQAPLLKRIEVLEARQLERGAAGENGKDGTSITVDDVSPMIADLVAKAFADAPKPQNGADGKNGIDGKDAEPINIVDVVRELVACPEIVPILALQATEAVVKHIEANPIRNGVDGKDGRDGTAGAHGEKGESGSAGKDGAGVADLLIDRDGNLVATMTDGRMKSLGAVVGKDGAAGKDGVDLSDVAIEYDGERKLEIKGPGGILVRTIALPLPMDAGFHADGMTCEKGDIVTCGGNAWIAQADTKTKPAHDNPAWRLFARKGRDAEVSTRSQRDDKPGAPVKLQGASNA